VDFENLVSIVNPRQSAHHEIAFCLVNSIQVHSLRTYRRSMSMSVVKISVKFAGGFKSLAGPSKREMRVTRKCNRRACDSIVNFRRLFKDRVAGKRDETKFRAYRRKQIPSFVDQGGFMLPTRFVCMFPMTVFILGAGMVRAQDPSTELRTGFPNKPIRLVTVGVGGAMDFMSRLLAQGLTVDLSQPVIVENRSSGFLPGQIVSKASPDGYTLLVAGPPLWIAPLLQSVPYDAFRDFSPITMMASTPNILVVNPSLPVKSVKELIALAKARPGQLNYASTGTGGSLHLAAELFKSMAGVNIVRINYLIAGTMINDLIGGQVQLMFGNSGAVVPHVKSGRLRALAITSAQPSALAPGLPTVAASGLPGYESASTSGVFAPAGTPAAIIKRLNQEMVLVLNRADVKEKFFNAGIAAIGSSPETLVATIKSEVVRMGKVIKDAGIRED
jgi:tripartite-type tricarboxylate transporter receptor subunit TctC